MFSKSLKIEITSATFRLVVKFFVFRSNTEVCNCDDRTCRFSYYFHSCNFTKTRVLFCDHSLMENCVVKISFLNSFFFVTVDLCSSEFRNTLTAIGVTAKDALMKHAAFKSPTRYYGILACILSVTEDLAAYIKMVFLEPSVRNVPMNHLVSVIT